MRLILLCDPFSSHSQKWISSLAAKGAEIFVVSLKDASNLNVDGAKKIFSLANSNYLVSAEEGSVRKINYLFNVWRVKKIIRQVKPDIVHAFYASSYGSLGALTNFHPFFISVWGSDVMSFPRQGFLHRSLLKFALSKADRIFATSKILVEIIKEYAEKEIKQIPFGVNLDNFRSMQLKNETYRTNFVIGSVKNLELNYGIDYLIRIFATLKEKNHGRNLKLLIIGDGKDKDVFMKLVKKLNLTEEVDFIGYVNHPQLPNYYNQMDVFANLSLRESFGVSVLEASASALPVVVSDIAGLKEVYKEGLTGFSINLNDEIDSIKKFQRLIDDAELRKKMGEEGRRFVSENYNWNHSIDTLWRSYEEELRKRK